MFQTVVVPLVAHMVLLTFVTISYFKGGKSSFRAILGGILLNSIVIWMFLLQIIQWPILAIGWEQAGLSFQRVEELLGIAVFMCVPAAYLFGVSFLACYGHDYSNDGGFGRFMRMFFLWFFPLAASMFVSCLIQPNMLEHEPELSDWYAVAWGLWFLFPGIFIGKRWMHVVAHPEEDFSDSTVHDIEGVDTAEPEGGVYKSG